MQAYVKNFMIWLSLIFTVSILVLIMYFPLMVFSYSARYFFSNNFSFSAVSGKMLQPQFKDFSLHIGDYHVEAKQLKIHGHISWFSYKHFFDLSFLEAKQLSLFHPIIGHVAFDRVTYAYASKKQKGSLKIRFVPQQEDLFVVHFSPLVMNEQYQFDTQYKMHHLSGKFTLKQGKWHVDVKSEQFLLGEIYGSGILSDDQISGSLNIQNINLDYFYPILHSRINGRIVFNKYKDDFSFQLNALKGVYREKNISGFIGFEQKNNLLKANADVHIGQARIQIQRNDKEAQFKVHMNIPDIMTIVPWWGGSFSFDAQSKGKGAAIPFELKALNLATHDYHIDSINFYGSCSLAGDVSAKLSMKEPHGLYNGLKLLNIDVRGSKDRYHYKVRLKDHFNQTFKIGVDLVKHGEIWQGMLNDFLILPQSIQLKSPVIFSFMPGKSFSLHKLCLLSKEKNNFCVHYEWLNKKHYLHIQAKNWLLNQIKFGYDIQGHVDGRLALSWSAKKTLSYAQGNFSLNQLGFTLPYSKTMHFFLPHLKIYGSGKRVSFIGEMKEKKSFLRMRGDAYLMPNLTAHASFQGENISVIDEKNRLLKVDPDIKLSFVDNVVKLRGRVYVNRVRMILNQQKIAYTELPHDIIFPDETREAAQGRKNPFVFDGLINIDLSDDVYINIYGLSGYVRGGLSVSFVNLDTILAKGRVYLDKGRFLFKDQSLIVRKANLSFLGESIMNPYMNLEAVRLIPEYNVQELGNDVLTVGISISGTSSNPHHRFFSSPSSIVLSNKQIISYLLIGYAPDFLDTDNAQTNGHANNNFAAKSLGGQVLNMLNLTQPFKKALSIDEIKFQTGNDNNHNNGTINMNDIDGTALVFAKRFGKRLYVRYLRSLQNSNYIFFVNYHFSPFFFLRSAVNHVGQSISFVYSNER